MVFPNSGAMVSDGLDFERDLEMRVLAVALGLVCGRAGTREGSDQPAVRTQPPDEEEIKLSVLKSKHLQFGRF